MFQPKYRITNKILKDIGVIEASREVINNSPLVPAWEAKFKEDALTRTVYHGTHVEGNELNFTEAEKVLEGKEIVGRRRDVQEIINLRNVLRFIDKFISSDTGEEFTISSFKYIPASGAKRIDQHVIKFINKLTVERIVEGEMGGEYRQVQVATRNALTNEISYMAPPAIEVSYLMDDFVNWFNSLSSSEIHPVLKAGIVHFELVRIHPFVEGNGRTARATATLSLFKDGYDIKKFFSLEEYYDKNPASYYAFLPHVGTTVDDDVTSWLEYFTEGLAIELSRVKEKVLKLSFDLKLKEKIGGKQIELNERQIKIVEQIEAAGFLQNKMFASLFPMISEDTILRDLKDLVKKGIIKKVGVTKSARYIMR